MEVQEMKKRNLVIMLGLLAACCVQATVAATRTEADRRRAENVERQFRQQFEKVSAEFAPKLEPLLKRAAELGLQEEVAALWERLKELYPQGFYDNPPAAAGVAASEAEIEQYKKEKADAFGAQANSLMALAQQCYRAGLIGRAYDMVWEAIRYDPDHRTARRLLGQVGYEGDWVSLYAANMMRRQMMFSDEFGWIRKADLPRYEQGLLPLGNRWLPREQVEAVRSTWAHAWIYETEHYRIRTNTALADAVEFGKYVEENYELFFRVFLGYFSAKSQSDMLFGVNQPKDKLQVNYLADRDEYLRLIGEGASGTLGVYTGRDKTAYFFKTDWSTNIRVLKHETTHQLFDASQRTSYRLSRGTWVVEACATYMETCRRRDSRIATEGANAPWVRNFADILKNGGEVAIQQFDEVNSYIGFQMLTIAYPQAASLAYYLMEFEDGKYRERFVDYVTAFYTGRLSRAGSLEEYIGVPFAEMDEEFHRFILGEDGYKERLQRLKERQQEGVELEVIFE